MSSTAGARGVLFTDPDTVRGSVRARNPLGVAMTPVEPAPPHLFLASPQAAGMTGEVLRPDGGLALGWERADPILTQATSEERPE